MDDEKFFRMGLQKIAGRNGDSLLPELLDRLHIADTNSQHSAVIVKLPGLHEREHRPISDRLPQGDATIISFPVPRWQRNADRKNG